MEEQKKLETALTTMADKVSNTALTLQKLSMTHGLKCFDLHQDHKQVQQCLQNSQKPVAELDAIVNLWCV